jgi:hypothetical protein
MTHTVAQSLFEHHERSLGLLFTDVEAHCRTLTRVTPGTPGSVLIKRNADGVTYYAHQFYDGEKRQRTRYLAGPVGSDAAEAVASELTGEIADTKGLLKSVRLLAREGFVHVDSKTWATVATLFNHGVFAAGGVLVGSHAFGAILNRMSARATPYTTEDVDLARPAPLGFARLPDKGLLDMLRDSGVQFFEVPGLDPGRPSTSFKQRGRSRFRVDLLVPSPHEDYPAVPVPELKAHATGLPYLGYLLEETQSTALLSRQGCCTVRIPIPERFAVHKLVVSQLRTGRQDKSQKDIWQAAVMAAALAEDAPGALEDARADLPGPAVRHLDKALDQAEALLRKLAPRAWDELTGST